MQTISSLKAAQVARAASLPSQVIAPVPVREVALEAPRQRNAILDAFFYDIGILRDDEAAMLAPRYAAEGAILSVGPSSKPTIEIWSDHEQFSAFGQESFRALAVAGVGSSALGAAAFARNVADAVGGKCLAVVSGYGLADLLTEAVGGYFLFGSLNAMRHMLEGLDDVSRPGSATIGTASALSERLVRKSLDVRTLTALLESECEFDFLVGHSKGNLVISEALYALEKIAPKKLAERGKKSHVITVSARVGMPGEMAAVTDVLGQIDGFGLLNSRPFIETDVTVPMAWHHTNTEYPMHLPVTETLAEILAEA